MSKKLEGGGLASGFRGLGITFRLVGWVSFWLKLVLTVVAGILVPFAVSASSLIQSRPVGLANAPQVVRSNPLNGFGLVIIVIGIAFLAVSVFWSFRYTRFARRFIVSNATTYPSKAETLRLVKFALWTDLLGMLVAVVGGEWIVGITLGEVIAQGSGFLNNRSVQPELFMIQACINTVAGQFAGIVSSLWLLQRITYVRPQE
jgi:hypothetical protein